jgi:hypothetical protein
MTVGFAGDHRELELQRLKFGVLAEAALECAAVAADCPETRAHTV